eukprot:jgi/Mesvir1/6509/Mv16778-RA.1
MVAMLGRLRGVAARGIAGAIKNCAGARGTACRAYSAQAAVAEAAPAPNEIFTRFSTPYAVAGGYLLSDPGTRVTTLSNGLRVATETTPYANTATVGVWIDAGSRYENDSNNGTAHFLEHMAFKGTKKRSTRDLELEVEGMGGHLNAYTSREHTTYYAKVFKKDVPVALDILSDILQNSSLHERAIENERSVILREMQEVEGQPDEVLFDHLHATAFQHSPLGRTILGSAANVRSITRDDLSAYIKSHYTAPRMVIAGAGAVDHDALVALAESKFSDLPSNPTRADDLVKSDPAFFTGSEVRIQDPSISPLYLAIALEGASWTDPDAIPLLVMQTMLGSWDASSGAGTAVSSLLGQRMAANKLCKSITAFNTNYKDTGLFGVYAQLEPSSASDAAWNIMAALRSLIYSASEEDVGRARALLKASMMLHLDGTSATAEDIGRQLLTYGRRIPKAEMAARIDAVDADTVKRVASRFIYDKELAIAAMGECYAVPDYGYLRRRNYSLMY